MRDASLWCGGRREVIESQTLTGTTKELQREQKPGGQGVERWKVRPPGQPVLNQPPPLYTRQNQVCERDNMYILRTPISCFWQFIVSFDPM